MNIVEKSMDAYEIADHIFNDKFSDKDIISIENLGLKDYFEMLSTVFLEGIFKFCKHGITDNNKINLNLLSVDDIIKINSYLNKIKIELKFKISTSSGIIIQIIKVVITIQLRNERQYIPRRPFILYTLNIKIDLITFTCCKQVSSL